LPLSHGAPEKSLILAGVEGTRFIFGRRPIFFNDQKKLSKFSHNVRKYVPVNTITASFNNIMGQTTEKCFRKTVR